MIILYYLNIQFLLEAKLHFIFPLTLWWSHIVGFAIKLLASHSATLPHSQLFTISTNPSIQFYSMQFNSKRLNSSQFNSFYHMLVPILILSSSLFFFYFLWMIKAYMRNRSGNLVNHSASFLWRVDAYNCVPLLTISSFPYTSYLMHRYSFLQHFNIYLLLPEVFPSFDLFSELSMLTPDDRFFFYKNRNLYNCKICHCNKKGCFFSLIQFLLYSMTENLLYILYNFTTLKLLNYS